MPVITTNTSANSALRYLNINSSNQTSALNRIASGSKITSAADDAAGLAVSMKLKNDVSVLGQAQTNASHATALLETADGALSQVGDILERMKVLATSSISGAVESERSNINLEYQKLINELGDIATNTEFNGTTLLDGTYAGSSVEAELAGTATMTYAGIGSAMTTGDTIAFTYDGKTLTATLSNGYQSVQGDFDTALKQAGYTAGALKVTLEVGTGNVTLTDTSMNDLLTSTGAVFTDQDGTSATVAGAHTDFSTAGSAMQTFDGVVAGLGDNSVLTAGDQLSFTVNGKVVTATVSNAYNFADTTTSSPTDLQADINAAMIAAGFAEDDVVPTSGKYHVDIDIDTAGALYVAVDTNASGITSFGGAEFFDKDGSGDTFDAKTLDFMVGVSGNDVISIQLADVRTTSLGSTAGTAISGTSVDSVANATAALDVIDAAVTEVANARAELGAQMSRFDYRSDTLAISKENLDAAQSAITDADVAEEQANLSSAKVLTNAAIAALSAANQMPQQLEKLFN
ncbi:flagellin [Pararhodospirillum photometricum]|uniref:Flagellin n=1 Tax=Pararhodospirillum photometricum DSM 122 TaxID=1150469 RepID=H6SN75_PARPM|nr:flagellin [Pararhodospirillum photometricum]CCG06951.1 Flagellin-like [Pararhodospirillum photometricum DSM 122]